MPFSKYLQVIAYNYKPFLAIFKLGKSVALEQARGYWAVSSMSVRLHHGSADSLLDLSVFKVLPSQAFSCSFDGGFSCYMPPELETWKGMRLTRTVVPHIPSFLIGAQILLEADSPS